MSEPGLSHSDGAGWPASAQPPMYLTELVGRADQVERLAALLRSVRLVSLVGPGGTGKTRLAAATVEALLEEADWDIGWIDLSTLTDSALVSRHVASTLGLREQAGRGAEQALIDRIAGARALLVLDNCEHVLTPCARLTETLLRGCPALRILATSREALAVAGEKAWRVPPLEVPAPDDPAAGDAAAVHLFAQRAADVLPSFAITTANLPAVARICRRVDGLPLAIELAAARVPVLPPEQLAARLDDMFRVLASRSEVIQPRHRTLRSLIDWSYALLSPGERWLFDRLPVFVGGFTLDAAERVVGGPAGEDVLDLLAALVEKSLVVMRDWRGEGRYSMLETVRQYAAERRISSPDDDAASDRLHLGHARYYADLVERLSAAARMEEGDHMARIEAEHENVRTALSWSLDHGRAELALSLCLGMRDFWRLRGYLGDGLSWTRRAADAARGDEALDGTRARALAAAAVHGRMTGDYLTLQGWLAEAESLARRADDPSALADVLTQLGLSLRDRRELAGARERLDEALALCRKAGDARALSTALGARASIALAEGDTALAHSLRVEAAEVAHLAGDREGEAYALIGLGEVARMEGNLEEARSCNQRCQALFRELGDMWHAAAACHNLGWIEAQAGRDGASFASFAECIALFRSAGNPFGLTLCLFGFARLLFRTGDADAAAVILAAASAHAARVGVRPAAPADVIACEETEAGIEAALPAAGRARASARGSAMSLSEGLEWAQERLRQTLVPVPVADPDAAEHDAGVERWSVGKDISPTPETLGIPAGSAVPDLRVLALGPLQVFVDGRPLNGEAFGSSKPRELLLLLLCKPDGLTREQVGLAFWPDASATQVKNSFHVMLHRLRKALGRPEWVVLEGDRYRLDPSIRVDFDAARFEAEVRAALRDDAVDAEPRLAAALALCRGEFLEGAPVGDWHLEVRDRLRRLYAQGLLARGGALMAAGRLEEAADAYRALLGRDRLDEQAWQGLMICQARSGQRVQAIRLYETLSLLLQEELGAEPDPATADLYQRLQRSESL